METTYKQLAHDYGVVGAGGAGFPTHVKLNASVEYLVINGAECEPLMSVDQVLMKTYPAVLAKTIDALRKELGAKEAIIGIKEKHADVITCMEDALSAYPTVRISPLGDFYPAGDEVVLVYETTGRQIPQGGIPLDCGVVVANIETIYNLSQAEKGHAVTDKWVTVAGNVADPGTYKVPLGVSIEEMIMLAGGAVIDEFAVINGGPMMGKLVTDLHEPVTKTTKGLLVLPTDNIAVQNRQRSLTNLLRQAQSVCCQCHICTDMCPRNLLGYDIFPNKTILAASYSFMTAGTQAGKGSLLCSECGLCDLYACPMGLSPRRINQMLKAELGKAKVSPPDKGKAVASSQWRPYRRTPTKRLIHHLGLSRYNSPSIWKRKPFSPDSVRIPLKQHIGSPSVPTVAVRDKVRKNDLIAEIPEGSLGSRIFASISGVVSEITSEYIIITKA